jgi:hypothetical protein
VGHRPANTSLACSAYEKLESYHFPQWIFFFWNLSFGLSSPVGTPTKMTFRGMTSVGMPRTIRTCFILSSYGYEAVQCPPSSRASAANRMFSLASDASIIAKSLLCKLAFADSVQTTMAAPALSIPRALAVRQPIHQVSFCRLQLQRTRVAY